jgi:hypothetical protein
MPIPRWMCIACLCAAFSGSAFGCFCVSTLMCSYAATPSDSSVVFVGRVVDIWTTRGGPRKKAASVRGPIEMSSNSAVARSPFRRRGTIHPASSEWGKIELQHGYMQRIRFVFSEVFAGAQVHEVFTDSSDCGYRFDLNHAYLVNSSRDGLRYRTGACSRTAPAESEEAVEDLKALHA